MTRNAHAVLPELREEPCTCPVCVCPRRKARRCCRIVQKGAPAMAGSQHPGIVVVPVAGDWYVSRVDGECDGLFRSFLANEQNDDAMDEDSESWQGNRRRRLWKSACNRAALNVSRIHTAIFLSFAETFTSLSLLSQTRNASCMQHSHPLRKPQ